MHEAKALPTPMISSERLNSYTSNPMEDSNLYKSLVGALQYVTIIKLEIGFSVNKVRLCLFALNRSLNLYRSNLSPLSAFVFFFLNT